MGITHQKSRCLLAYYGSWAAVDKAAERDPKTGVYRIPAPITGELRHNKATMLLEVFDGDGWVVINREMATPVIDESLKLAFWLHPDWSGGDNLLDPNTSPFWVLPALK